MSRNTLTRNVSDGDGELIHLFPDDESWDEEIVMRVIEECFEELKENENLGKFLKEEKLTKIQIVKLFLLWGFKSATNQIRGKKKIPEVKAHFKSFLQKLTEEDQLFIEPNGLDGNGAWKWYTRSYLRVNLADHISNRLTGETETPGNKIKRRKNNTCFGFFISTSIPISFITDHYITIPSQKNSVVVTAVYREISTDIFFEFGIWNVKNPKIDFKVGRLKDFENEDLLLFQFFCVDCERRNQTRSHHCEMCTRKRKVVISSLVNACNILNDREKAFGILVGHGRGTHFFRSILLQNEVKKSVIHHDACKNILLVEEKQGDSDTKLDFAFDVRFLKKPKSGRKKIVRIETKESETTTSEKSRINYDTKKIVKIIEALLHFFLEKEEYSEAAIDTVSNRIKSFNYGRSKIGDLSDLVNYFVFTRALKFSVAQYITARKLFHCHSYSEVHRHMNEKTLELANKKHILLLGSTGIFTRISEQIQLTTTRSSAFDIVISMLSNFITEEVYLESSINPERFDFIYSILKKYIIREVSIQDNKIVGNTARQFWIDATRAAENHAGVKKIDITISNNVDCSNPLKYEEQQVVGVNCGEYDHCDWGAVHPGLRNDLEDVNSLVCNGKLRTSEVNLLSTICKEYSSLNLSSSVTEFELHFEPFLSLDMVGGNNLMDQEGNYKCFRLKYSADTRYKVMCGDLDVDTSESFSLLELASPNYAVLLGYGPDESYDVENETIFLRGSYPIRDPSVILKLNSLRNMKWCELHIIGSAGRYGQKSFRENGTFLAKQFYPKSTEKMEMFENRSNGFWIDCGLMTLSGEDIEYKNYQNLSPQLINAYKREVHRFVNEIGISSAELSLSLEDYDIEHFPIFKEQILVLSNICVKLRNVDVLTSKQKWAIVKCVDFYIVVMERNQEFVSSISDYAVVIPSLFPFDVATQPDLKIRGDTKEHMMQNVRSNDDRTSGLVDNFGQTNIKFYSYGDDENGEKKKVTKENNYCLQQFKLFQFLTNPRRNVFRKIEEEDEVTFSCERRELKNPSNIVVKSTESRSDRDFDTFPGYQEHIEDLFDFFTRITEYNLKKRKLIMGYHTVLLDGDNLPDSYINWFREYQKPIDSMLYQHYCDGENDTIVGFCGAGKTALAASDSYKILHNVEKGTILYFTTTTVKPQVGKDYIKFENTHRLVQACVEVLKSRPGITVLKKLYRKKKRVMVFGHSNVSGLRRLLESENNLRYYLEVLLSEVGRIYIDEADEATGKEKNKKFKDLVWLIKNIMKLRNASIEKRQKQLNESGYSRISVPRQVPSLVFMSATIADVVGDSVVNCFKLVNSNFVDSHQGNIIYQDLLSKMKKLKNVFKMESEFLVQSSSALGNLEIFCNNINTILFRDWKNLHIIGPDQVTSGNVNVDKIYVVVDPSETQEIFYKQMLIKFGVDGEKMEEEEEDGEMDSQILQSGILPSELSRRMTLNQVSPKIFDDPNVYIEDIYDDQVDRMDHIVSDKECPKIINLKLLVRIAVSMNKKLLAVGRSVRAVEFLKHHIKASLPIFKKDIPIFVMSGKTSEKDRESFMEKYRNHDGCAIFCSSVNVISKGCNLQCVEMMYIFSIDFNPAKEDQLVCRADRSGRDDDLLSILSVTGKCVQLDTFYRYLAKFYCMRKLIYDCDIKPPDLNRGEVNLVDYFGDYRGDISDLTEFNNKWVSKCYDHYKLFGRPRPTRSRIMNMGDE